MNMSYTVIHYEQRRQYLLIFIACLIFSFGLGYWFGYHTNASDDFSESKLNAESYSHHPLDAETVPASMTTPTTTSVAALSSSKLPIPVAGTPAKVTTPSGPAGVRPQVPAVVPVKPVMVVAPKVTPVVTASKPLAAIPVLTSSPVTEAKVAETPGTHETITNDSLSADAVSTFYTAQAEVFDSRENAMKLVTELNGKGFEAYVHEYVGGTGSSRFNVRFARNTDREYTQKKLTRYKQIYTSSAYIVTEK